MRCDERSSVPSTGVCAFWIILILVFRVRMAAGPEVMKIEMEVECCCVCGVQGELMTPEEYDAAAPPMSVPLRTMLLHLNNNRALPEGRLCGACVQRALDSYEFSTTLGGRAAQPLSDKIRALRRRLHDLTQKIDVFIVVGGPAAGGGGVYNEEDIIMVEKDALAAAAAADDEEMEHARNARGDTVYQCTVCPLSFQRMSEYREHCSTHGEGARHSCWTCGAQFATRGALRDHSAQHATLLTPTCYLCDNTFQSQAELRRHEAGCPARCPCCGAVQSSRAELSRHAAAAHARGAPPPLCCPACFRTFEHADLLSAHLLRHRQARQFVCGYGDCVLRFANRSNLMAHIRKTHAAELPPEVEPEPKEVAQHACDHCDRTFASAAALKRHMRVHRAQQQEQVQEMDVKEVLGMEGVQYVLEGEGEEDEGEVEYLEMETLEDDQLELQLQDDRDGQTDTKPDIAQL